MFAILSSTVQKIKQKVNTWFFTQESQESQEIKEAQDNINPNDQIINPVLEAGELSYPNTHNNISDALDDEHDEIMTLSSM
jgi:hypothetical protein